MDNECTKMIVIRSCGVLNKTMLIFYYPRCSDVILILQQHYINNSNSKYIWSVWTKIYLYKGGLNLIWNSYESFVAYRMRANIFNWSGRQYPNFLGGFVNNLVP